jgi:hypothetical protein
VHRSQDRLIVSNRPRVVLVCVRYPILPVDIEVFMQTDVLTGGPNTRRSTETSGSFDAFVLSTQLLLVRFT